MKNLIISLLYFLIFASGLNAAYKTDYLTVTVNAKIYSAASIGKTSTPNCALDVSGNAALLGDFNITGNQLVSGTLTVNALSVNASADVTVNVGYVKLGTRTGAGAGRATFGHKNLSLTEQALVQTNDGITLLNSGIGKQINFSLGNAIKGTIEPAGNWIFGATSLIGSGIVQINGNTLVSGNINCLGTITGTVTTANYLSSYDITVSTANYASTANNIVGTVTTANVALMVSVNATNQVLSDLALQASSNVNISGGSITGLSSMTASSSVITTLNVGSLTMSVTPTVNYGSTSTIVGITSITKSQIEYSIFGNIVFCTFDIRGTGNGTTFTFTLPYRCATNVSILGYVGVRDNGVDSDNLGSIIMEIGSNIVQLYRSNSVSTWTPSNARVVQGSFMYITY
jgi:hypothetical protein